MRVAIYARVSTDEQTEQNQVAVLEQWAKDRGWPLVDRYCDVGSAWRENVARPEFDRLLADCSRGKVNLILVFDLSRLTRKGPLEMLLSLRKFGDNGAQVYSYSETWLNVPNEFNAVLVSVFGYMAQKFSEQQSMRTKAGMARAKAEGKHVGRPRKQ